MFRRGDEVSSDVLDILNKDCDNKATIVYTEIDWRKFHKLDLLLLIPAIILGSLFITIISHYLTAVDVIQYILRYMLSLLGKVVDEKTYIILTNLPYQLIILRGISSFFIIRLILRAVQGVIVNKYGLPTIFRSYALWVFCFVIVAIPGLFASGALLFGSLFPDFFPYIVDIGSMFLLTYVVWRRYMKPKVKHRRHFFVHSKLE